MSVRVARLEDGIGLRLGMPDVADLADLWLVHAVAYLLDACDVPEPDRRKLVESGRDVFEPPIMVKSSTADEAARLEHLDACRLALEFATLAVEARLNGVLRRWNADEWRALAHLAPAEKFRLLPRLLDGNELAVRFAELSPLVDELFDVRDELVDAGGPPGSALRFSPSRARAMVEASAKVCCVLETLIDDEERRTARLARRAAEALARRADALVLIKASSSTRIDRDPSSDIDFPPDLVEW